MDERHLCSDSLFALVEKLGHPIEEIRSRSLKNLIFKLEHGLVKEHDLIKETRLLLALFGWFNFPDSKDHGDVLQLIFRLSKHPVASEYLIKFGAVKFLSELRGNCCQELQKIVDSVLERLFLLPDINVNEINDDNESLHDVVSMLKERFNLKEGHLRENSDQKLENQCENHEFEFIGLKMFSLKWINISQTDIRILKSTNASILGDNPKLVIKSCNFLNDVMFKDFPPEAFLQQSYIIKSLLWLISHHSKSNPGYLPLKSVTCLLQLVRSLLSRVVSYCDIAMYNLKEYVETRLNFCGVLHIDLLTYNLSSLDDLVKVVPTHDDSSGPSVESHDSRPFVIGNTSTRYQGDGQDRDISPSESANGNNHNELHSVNRTSPTIDGHPEEMSIPQFCLLIFINSSSLLESANPQVLSSVFELLNWSNVLLSHCINTDIWRDTSCLAKEIVIPLIIKCYDILASAILHHNSSNYSCDYVLFKTHRLAVIGIATIWAKLIQSSIGYGQVSCSMFSKSCISAISTLTMDLLFAKSFPELHSFFSNWLNFCDNNKYECYKSAKEMSSAFTSAVQFVKNIKATGGVSESFILANEALVCIPYLQYWEFIECFIKAFSTVCSSDTKSSHLDIGYSVLLKMLTIPDYETRKNVYAECLAVVKNCLGIKTSASTSLSANVNVRFLFQSNVLRQIVFFGFQDTFPDISSMAKEIILYLIQSKVIVLPEVWEDLLEGLIPVLTLLQSYTDYSSPLGIALFHLVDIDNAYWSHVHLLKANVRLLFSKHKRLRLNALPRIAWLLGKEIDSLNKYPTLLNFDISCLSDLFVEEANLPSLDLQPGPISLQTAEKLLQIFSSEKCDVQMRKSAGHQLLFLLNESTVFNYLKSDIYYQLFDILNSLFKTKKSAMKQPPITVELTPVTVDLIWLCFTKDFSIADLMSKEGNIYYSLIRAIITFNSNQKVCGQIRIIVAASLFYEYCDFQLKTIELPERIFSTVDVIHNRFYLPNSVTTKVYNNEHTFMLPMTLNDDQHTLMLYDTFLKFSWSCSNAGGWERFLLVEDGVEEIEKFRLNQEETLLIRISAEILNPDAAFLEIRNAKAHKPVLLAIRMLSLSVSALSSNCELFFTYTNAVSLSEAFSRYLSAPPKSKADKALLRALFNFFNLALSCNFSINNDMIDWMYDIVSLKSGAVQSFLQNSDTFLQHQYSRENYDSCCPVLKELLVFIISLLSKSAMHMPNSESVTNAFSSILRFAIWHMNIAKAPQFYDLASLETVLQCIMHISSKLGFSQYTDNDLNLKQIIGTLMEVIAAFHLDRDSATHTFMGRGIILAATISLNHICAELAAYATAENWIEEFLCNSKSDGIDLQFGFEWLIPLWTHTDLEVRASSLGIAVSLTQSEFGCAMVLFHMRHVSHGLMGVGLGFLLEFYEACIVREQAAFLLANIISYFLSNKCKILESDIWRDQIIRDPETHQVSTNGIDAVLTILHRSSFMKDMATLFQNFFYNPILISDIRSRLPLNEISDKSSSSTQFSLDFGVGVLTEARMNLDGGMGSQTLSLRNSHPESLSHFSDANNIHSRNTEAILKSLTTPTLVSAVCLILKNLLLLAPTQIAMSLKKENILEHLIRILDEEKSIGDAKSSLVDEHNLNCPDVLDMKINVIELLATYCHFDPSVCDDISQNKLVPNAVLNCLKNATNEILSKKLLKSAYALLTYVVKSSSKSSLDKLLFELSRHNNILKNNFESGLQPRSQPELRCTMLSWLIETLRTSYKELTHCSLNNNRVVSCVEREKPQTDKIMIDAKLIASKLLLLYKMLPHDPDRIIEREEEDLICQSLSIILAFENIAKEAALHGGLISDILEYLKRILVHMNLLSLNSHKPPDHLYGKESITLSLINNFNVLKSLMYNFDEAKIFASNLGFAGVISQFWKLVILEKIKLLPSLLSLLCTYTARCPAACKSLATTSVPSEDQKNSAGGTLLKEIVRLYEDELKYCNERPSSTTILELCTTLLATMISVPCCRILIIKGTLLQRISSRALKKVIPRGSQKEIFLDCWLKLFINLSFQSDGQDIILNIPDIMDILSNLLHQGCIKEKEKAMLIVRNLCFLPSGKAKLLNTAELVTVINTHALNGSGHLQTLAASAIWTLLANSHKAKGILKGDYFKHRVEHAIARLDTREKLTIHERRTLEILNIIKKSLMTNENG